MAYILTEQKPKWKPLLEKGLTQATALVKKYMPKYASGTLYPAKYENGAYQAIANGDPRGNFWEEGFYPGQLWLSYEATKDEAYRALAEKNVQDFYHRVKENDQIDWHHDTGFLYTPSCVAAYMLTGNETAKKAAEMAAYSLSRRFRPRGQFIQSMSFEMDEQNYKFIVDTILNLPLLFWAAEETGDSSYREKAIAHLHTTIRYAMREDGSTFHHFLMNERTGEPVRGFTWQGASDDSCWSRGQAWVLYGLALAYRWTKDETLLEPFYKATDYFFEHLPADRIPYWDFSFSDGSPEPRDSSAGAIAVCGILEMANSLPETGPKMQHYLEEAAQLLAALVEKCGNVPESDVEGLLLHATGAKPQGSGIDACLPYGDYFYLEALVRATRNWRSYW